METGKFQDLKEDIELLNFRLCNKSKLSKFDIKIMRSLKSNVDFILDTLNQNKTTKGVRNVQRKNVCH